MAHPSSEFNDPEILRTCLQMLDDEGSKHQVRVAVETLLKLSRNLSSHPGDEKYRKIRKENKAIHEKLLRFEGAKEFLLAMGWTEIDDMLMYLEDHDLSVTTSILEEHLHTLPPPQTTVTSPSAATPAAPTETVSWTEAELKQRDEKLEKEKKRRMEEYQRMKKEREAIKKQIKEDRKDTQTREVKDSHARQLHFGANVKKFENRGGG